MKLIVGLGNPGAEYMSTRHNVGYLVVDQLNESRLPGSLVAKKTGVFMNSSGESVEKLLSQYKLPLENLYIIHDDLDIALGEYKIQFAKGPHDHNGLKSIYEKLGTKDFWHVRVGVDNRKQEERTPGEEYVLQDFESDEKDVLGVVIKEICKKLVTL